MLGGALFDGTDLEDADFASAELMGADLSTALKADDAHFDTAYYDATTVFSPDMDASGMYEVMGTCPLDPSLMLIDMDGDGAGDECHELRSTPLPEPGGLAMLGCGSALLLALRRQSPARQRQPAFLPG